MKLPLDPRDSENWLALSKQYEHLRDFSKDGKEPYCEIKESSNTLFAEKTNEWMRSDEGLIALKDIWLAAFHMFYKHEGLEGIDVGGWRRCITIAAITDTRLVQEEACLELDTTGYPGYYKHMFGTSQSESEREQWKAYGKDPMNYRVSSETLSTLSVVVHIGIRSTTIRDQWEELSDTHTKLLEKNIWRALVAAIPELSVDDPNGAYSDISDFTDGFSILVSRIERPVEPQRLINRDFNTLFSEILHPKRTQPERGGRDQNDKERTTENDRPYIDLGRLTHPVEKSLATFLRSCGYLVILEPELHLPNPEANTYRNPDLFVVDKGRVLAIEIDDTSHLIDHDNNGKANVTKWKRDRLLDQVLLRSGIPVLRVWHTEARERPEQVLTKITETFESLGGGRLFYR